MWKSLHLYLNFEVQGIPELIKEVKPDNIDAVRDESLTYKRKKIILF